MCTENICITIDGNDVTLESVLINNFSQLTTLELIVDDIYNATSTTTLITSADIVNNTITKELAEGIYRIKLRASYTNGNITNYHVCAFVDVTYKCDLVDTSIDGIMMHYALTKITGCSCNCDQMKEIFEAMLAEKDKEKAKPCPTC